MLVSMYTVPWGDMGVEGVRFRIKSGMREEREGCGIPDQVRNEENESGMRGVRWVDELGIRVLIPLSGLLRKGTWRGRT